MRVLVHVNVGLSLEEDQEGAKASDGGVLAPEAALPALVAQEDDVQALCLVVSAHRELASEAALHALSLQPED